MIGTTFAGDYEIERLLGRGGFASVYLAVHRSTGRRVAIKLLQTPDERYVVADRARFLRELRAVGELRSPHTVRLFAHGEAPDGQLYAVFEYLQGRELGEVLAEHGTLSASVAQHILEQLLEALDEAHRAGVLHRDLKPQNVLVVPAPDDNWFVKLIDFGIARALDHGSPSVTATGEILGTPRYMSPEQLKAQPLTPASDLYSLALLTCELLLGEEALTANTIGAQLGRAAGVDQIALPHDVPVALRSTLSRMLQVDPGRRPQRADAVRRMITGVEGPGVGRTKQPPAAYPVPQKQSARRWLPAAVVAAAAAGAAALTTVVVHEPAPPPPPRVQAPLSTAAAPSVRPPLVHPRADLSPPIVVSPGSAGCDGPAEAVSDANLFVPKVGPDSGPLPLVVLLHGRWTTAEGLLKSGGFVRLAQEHRFAVFAPQSRRANEPTPPTHIWTPNEVPIGGAVADPLDDLMRDFQTVLEDHCIDMQRIFAVGHSGGGNGVHRLMCRLRLAGAAMVSAPRSPPGEPCRLSSDLRLAPVIRIHSRQNPQKGPNSCGGAKRIADENASDESWAAALGCVTEQPAFTHGAGVAHRAWQCPDYAFESWMVDGSGDWTNVPRIGPDSTCNAEPPTHDFAATIWRFFSRQPGLELDP